MTTLAGRAVTTSGDIQPETPVELRARARETSDPEQREVLFTKADVLEGLADPGRVRAPEWRPPPFDEDPADAEDWEQYQAELVRTEAKRDVELIPASRIRLERTT